MGYQEEQNTLHDPQGLPTLFTTLDANLFRECEGVGEHSHGNIEADRVFAQIDGRLGGSHSNRVIIHKCYYILVGTAIYRGKLLRFVVNYHDLPDQGGGQACVAQLNFI